MANLNLLRRPRRNRQSAAIRAMAQETRLHPSDLIAPYFIIEGQNIKQAISSMPGVFRLSIDCLLKEIEELIFLGVPAIALFPVIPNEKKDITGSESLNPEGFLPEAIRIVKKAFPSICVITDIALDPYTTHGHDGLVSPRGEILNDETVDILTSMAKIQAQAGVDIVAPSDMMDGRVRAIREALDREGFTHVGIMAYAAKYASALYSPFRDALQSAPRFGNKMTYQMNPANSREAILEAQLDEEEGADFLMVKPALPYLDIISKIRQSTSLPIAAYQVSGEYAMIMAAAEQGWMNADSVFMECLLGIKRAGADVILTYAAGRIARQLYKS
jgi:porphobilinogen synthase